MKTQRQTTMAATGKPSLDRVAAGDTAGIVLSNGLVSVTVLPACGGKIAQIRDLVRDHSWLWANPHLPPRVPTGTGRYVEEFDNGGWDECFPTIAPGSYPEGALAGRETGDHGVLWELPWRVVEEVAGELGCGVTLAAKPAAFPVVIERHVWLAAGAAEFRVSYRLRNLSPERMAFLWAIHPLLPIGDGVSLHFPPGTTVRVTVLEGAWKGGAPMNEPIALPRFLSSIADPAQRGEPATAAKFFTESLPGGWGAVRDAGGGELRFTIEGGTMDGFGVWINRRWWSGCGSAPYANVGFEPVIGACDSLRQSMLAGTHAQWVEGDGERRWSLRVGVGSWRDRAGDAGRPP